MAQDVEAVLAARLPDARRLLARLAFGQRNIATALGIAIAVADTEIEGKG
ncbi:hypothetical protein [Streptomyces sp. NPDC058307]